MSALDFLYAVSVVLGSAAAGLAAPQSWSRERRIALVLGSLALGALLWVLGAGFSHSSCAQAGWAGC